MNNIYRWLNEKMIPQQDEDGVLVDIGAYHGEFTQHLLLNGNLNKAHLFEPNKKHFNFLKNQYAQKENIFLYSCALGNKIETHEFCCSEDDATGSLLPYHPKYHHEKTIKKVEYFPVEVKTLDACHAEHFPNDPIKLIKIDTQGFDLQVLKGSSSVIQQYKPWLVVELNFLPFYVSQTSLSDLLYWLTSHGYVLAALFNDHYSKDHWLAFADGVFVPEETIDVVLEPFIPRSLEQQFLEENILLQKICQERLDLIHSLQKECENRLQVIHSLTHQMKEMKKQHWLKKILNRWT